MTATTTPAINLDAVRDFVDNEICPQVTAYTATGDMPSYLLDGMTELGLWVPCVDARYGGRNASWTDYGLATQEIGRGDSSMRSIMTAHCMVGESIARFGTDEQRERWLPLLNAGMLASFCLTGKESGAAADVSGTVAIPDGHGGWTITGAKRWTTSGQSCGLILLFCLTHNDDGTDGMTAFLIPRETPGVSSIPTNGMLGARANLLAEMRFDHVRVGPDAVLGEIGWAKPTVMTNALALGRFSVASGCVGMMQACLDEAVAHTGARVSGGVVLAQRQLVRQTTTKMLTSLHAARLLCADVGRLRDAGDPDSIMIGWLAKYFASTNAAKVTHAAVQLLGAQGCAPHSRVARFYSDSVLHEIIEGTTATMEDTIADLAYRATPRGETSA